ncbi:MAG: hypothetical protein ACREHG_05005 [Candidatus Saccharimonadales bacterium]
MATNGQTSIEIDALATVRRAAAAYHVAERGSTAKRSALRRAMVAAVGSGQTVTEVAAAAGVPRLAVYRAMGKVS